MRKQKPQRSQRVSNSKSSPDEVLLSETGKAPIITFSKETGDRDQAWTDIADVIEKRAKARS